MVATSYLCLNCSRLGFYVGSVHDVIEAFRDAPSNSERGTKFEQLMVRYFELDPMLSQEYDQVWRWMDWPERAGKPDTGIDLVARNRDTGALTAIQCKFYEPTHTLAKADIDSFFTPNLLPQGQCSWIGLSVPKIHSDCHGNRGQRHNSENNCERGGSRLSSSFRIARVSKSVPVG